jgi:hypothetical protein
MIGFNPNYPALHMREALETIVRGESVDLGWNADDIGYVIAQADTLIAERGKSFTQHELSSLNALLRSIRQHRQRVRDEH